MASIFDDMPSTSTNPNALGSTGYSFYDADTLYDADGKGYRLQGVDALEVDRTGKAGQVGGQLTTEQAVRLANDLGYTNIVKTGQMDVTGQREIVDLQDKQGRSFRRQLASSGLAKGVGEYDPGGSLSYSSLYRDALRTTDQYEANDFDKAADLLEQHIKAEDADTLKFKQKRLIPGWNGEHIAEEGAVFEKAGIDTKSGESLSPLSTAWDTGMIGVSESMWGMASLLGEKLGVDYAQIQGEAGVDRARARIADQGKILTDYQDVDSFGDAVSYVANNAVLSIPYMAITAAATVAAPVTGGLSLTAPAAVYTGQAWNEMGDQIKENGKERSATVAIATGVTQAALDRLGIAGVLKAGHPSKVFKEGVDKLVASGMTKDQATAALSQATKREMAELVGDVGRVAKSQVEAKHLVTDLAKRAGKGGASEAVTEGLQESVAAIGADIGSGSDIDWVDVQDRAIQGVIAGGTLGGAFAAPGTALDAGQWANLAWGVDREDPKSVGQSTRYAREEEAKNGYVPTIQELTAENRAAPDSLTTLTDRADNHRSSKKARDTGEVIADAMASIPSLWRGSARWIFSADLQSKSRSARVLADMFGGNLQRIFGGSNFENSKHHRVTTYKNMVDFPDNVYAALNGGRKVTGKDKVRISDEFYATAQNAIDAEGNFNPDLVPEGPMKQHVVRLATQLNQLGDKMHADQKQYNNELGYVGNYLLKYKALDKSAVNNNRSEFIDSLKTEFNMSEAEAKQLTDTILDTDMDLDEAFTVAKGGPRPQSHKRRTLGLSEKDAFQKFMEKDLFTNVAQAAKSAARFTAYQEFIGDNAKHISKLLDGMEREGVPTDQVNKVAAQIQDLLDAESGNYKRATSEFGKGIQRVQKNFMLFTTMAGLPLATISSFVEAALTMRGLTRDQIFGKGKGLSHLGGELARTMYDGMGEVAAQTPGVGARQRDFNTKGKNALKNLGFYDWDVGAATTTGVVETHAWHQGVLENYFKWTGLQGWTNYTRAVRAAIAGDYIMDNIGVYLERDPNNPTNEVREAEEKLRNLGIDVSRTLPALQAFIKGEATPEQEAEMAEVMREAQFNFVNEAVALPQAGNRPLIYQDPRFALFTQFQGFISTFTANHIPRLWGEYISRGSPAMRYNTFALMSTMIALGFASQYLKDLIKYGGTTPYLDESELIQRGVRASGLLGTSERVLDQFFPLYEQRSNTAGEWLWNTGSGESPAISNLARLGAAGGDLIEGDLDRAGWKAAKSTIGPLANVADTWVFDGGN